MWRIDYKLGGGGGARGQFKLYHYMYYTGVCRKIFSHAEENARKPGKKTFEVAFFLTQELEALVMPK